MIMLFVYDLEPNKRWITYFGRSFVTRRKLVAYSGESYPNRFWRIYLFWN